MLLICARAAAAELAPEQLLELSPEDLGRLQVSSVSRKLESLSTAPASVYVITAEDIRRSTATTVPEVLRLAPTLQVAQDNGIPAYISARGHTSGVYAGAQKLLVLIDGRSVYSQFFSGVLWDAQDLVLEDIERIEVITGPAGVLWGVNAVNGVINIITRSSEATQGTLASVNVGDRARDGALRYGGKLADGGSYRVYAKYLNRGENARQIDGKPLADYWRSTLVGSRADWTRGASKFSLQFNATNVNEGQPEPGAISVGAPSPLPPVQGQGVNLLGRWVQASADGGTTSFQAYLDHSYRNFNPAIVNVNNTVDLELHRNLAAAGAHALSFGGNFRLGRESSANGAVYLFDPEVVSQRWLSAFVQDDMALSERLRVIAGARVERGPYATTDVLPSLRVAWQAQAGHTLWSGISRGARGPSRFDSDFRIPAFAFFGNPRLKSETVEVAEVGYRAQGSKGIFSLTLFRSFYDKLGAVVRRADGSGFETANGAKGQSNGLEAWADYRLTPHWRVGGGVTLLSENYYDRPGIQTTGVLAIAGSSPGQTAQLRASWDLAPGKELDLILRHVSSLTMFDTQLNGFEVPSYNAIDARFGWKISKQLELSVAGQNLLGTGHAEYNFPQLRGVMSQRIFTKLTWRQ